MSELDPVYRQARASLDPVLEARGFRLAAECHYPDAFGSAHAEYRARGIRLRLIWDGKDRWLWVTHAPQIDSAIPRDQSYKDLEASGAGSPPSARVLREGPIADERI